ncbi:MAG TPA: hypothetical protein VHO91_22760 [Rhodopila sp.]|nr:hypothetical protein [Rhodopila sp.]
MTALAQGSAGIALVICFALLRTRQVKAAALLLLAQCAAVAVAAMAQHRPELAPAPLLLGGAVWVKRHRTAVLGLLAPPLGGPTFGVLVGAVLAALCQSQGDLAQPLAILLLAALLATTRPHAVMQVMALVVAQNGVVLAASHLPVPPVTAIAGLLLPLPLLAALMAGHPRPGWHATPARPRQWLCWVCVALSAGIFAATLTAPLDPLAAVFAPLFGFEGLLRAWIQRRRTGRAPLSQAAAVARTGCVVLAVGATDPLLAWMAILGAMTAALLPVLERRWQSATLGFYGAALALFGLSAGGVLGFPGLLAGYAVMAVVVPDLAAPLAVLVLRQVDGAIWSPAAAWLTSLAAVGGLLGCAALLRHATCRHRVTMLHLAQVSIALLAIGLDRPDGRYAAMVLLILLTLTRAASRAGHSLAAALATAGLGGVPPLGVFPALCLVMLAVGGQAPWLLLPLGAALVLIVPASLPARLPVQDLIPLFAPGRRAALLSAAWLPLALAAMIGFMTPDSLARWLQALTAGAS